MSLGFLEVIQYVLIASHDYTCRISEANAHRNHLPRWFHWCASECASTTMRIRVWTLESRSNAHNKCSVNRPLNWYLLYNRLPFCGHEQCPQCSLQSTASMCLISGPLQHCCLPPLKPNCLPLACFYLVDSIWHHLVSSCWAVAQGMVARVSECSSEWESSTNTLKLHCSLAITCPFRCVYCEVVVGHSKQFDPPPYTVPVHWRVASCSCVHESISDVCSEKSLHLCSCMLILLYW